jgi:hypothetical protein
MPLQSTKPASRSQTQLAPTLILELNGRQEATRPARVVTLSITRDTTTFTTIIVLGGSTGDVATPATNYQSVLTTTATSGSSPTIATPVAHKPNGIQAGAIVGIALGTIFGTILTAYLIWLCCYSPYRPRFPSYGQGGSGLGTWKSEVSQKSSRRRRSRSTRYVRRQDSLVYDDRHSRPPANEPIVNIGAGLGLRPPVGGGSGRPGGVRIFSDRDIRPAARRP